MRELGLSGLDQEFLEEFAPRWWTAWNERDADAIAAMITEDIAYHNPAVGEDLVGRAAMIEYAGLLAQAFADGEFTATEPPYASLTQPKAMVPWHFEGTHKGDFVPMGLKASGGRLVVSGSTTGGSAMAGSAAPSIFDFARRSSRSPDSDPMIQEGLDQDLLEDVAERCWAAWNAHDGEAVAALCTDDVVLLQPGARRRHQRPRGDGHLRRRVRAGRSPDMTFVILRAAVRVADAAEGDCPWRFEATHDGPFGPMGLEPTGGASRWTAPTTGGSATACREAQHGLRLRPGDARVAPRPRRGSSSPGPQDRLPQQLAAWPKGFEE